jgi:hypothetical protein
VEEPIASNPSTVTNSSWVPRADNPFIERNKTIDRSSIELELGTDGSLLFQVVCSTLGCDLEDGRCNAWVAHRDQEKHNRQQTSDQSSKHHICDYALDLKVSRQLFHAI